MMCTRLLVLEGEREVSDGGEPPESIGRHSVSGVEERVALWGVPCPKGPSCLCARHGA